MVQIENNAERFSQVELNEKIEIILIERASQRPLGGSLTASTTEAATKSNKNQLTLKQFHQNRFILGQFYFEQVSAFLATIAKQNHPKLYFAMGFFLSSKRENTAKL